MKNYFLLLATALVTMSAGAQKVEMSVELMQPAQKVAVANQQIQIKQLSKGIVAHSVNTPSGKINKVALDLCVKSKDASNRVSVRTL